MKKKKTKENQEFNFQGAKRNRGIDKSKTKIAISVRLDGEVVSWLRNESEKVSIPYQTLLNSILKQHIDEKETLQDRIKKLETKVFKKKTA